MPQKKKPFKPSVSAETQFARALRKIGRVSGHIVEAHVDGVKITNSDEMQAALKAYSKLITPWAAKQSAKMLEKVSKSNRRAYNNKSKAIGKEINLNVAESDIGKVAQDLMSEQIALIQSIPIRAGERAQRLALEAVYNGTRASEIAQALMESSDVSESVATTIARTEVARSNASISQARSTSVGSTQYRWRNSGDEAVRESHKKYKGKKLDGMVFSWDSPPTLDDGMTGNPGTFPNCRCYAEAIFDGG